MHRIPFLERIELSARLPIGQDGFWALILDLDAAGPWTAGEVAARTQLNPGTPRDYIRCLKAGGFVEQVGTKPTRGRNPQPAPLYKLTRRPLEAPRLRRDGTSLPERGIERLWRAMKMAKTFTVAELAELVEPDGTINRDTVSSYCRRLTRAGLLARVPSKSRETRFRLVLNIGRRAPKILETKAIFDPNANRIVGEPETREVHL